MGEDQTLDVAALKTAHHPLQDRIYETCSILYHGACAACRDQYPCPTVQLIDAYERQQADLAACRAENERLATALQGVIRGVISSNTGPAAHCFDVEDYEVERNRWYAVDGKAVDDVCAALQSREEVG